MTIELIPERPAAINKGNCYGGGTPNIAHFNRKKL